MTDDSRDKQWLWWSALTVIAVALTVWHPVEQGDPWFHLTHGRDHVAAGIVPLTDTLPLTDTYSWTADGTAWQSSGWLFGMVSYQLYRFGGHVPLTLLPPLAVITGAGVVGWLVRRRGHRVPVAAAAAAAAAFVVALGAGVRPQLFTYVTTVPFVVSVLVAVTGQTWQRRTGAAVVAAALTVLWVNLHSGGLGTVLLAVAVTVGTTIDAAQATTSTGAGTPTSAVRAATRTVRRGGTVVAACAAATLLNPYGTGIWTHAAMVRQVSWPLNEWQSAWDRPWLAALVLGPAGAAAAVATYRAAKTRTGWWAVIPTIVWVGLTADALRHIVQLGLLAVVAVAVTTPPTRRPARHTGPWLGAVTAVCVTAAGFNLVTLPGTLPKPAAGVTDGVNELPQGCKLLNDLMVGGYVLWARPDVQVSVDGRNDLYGAEPVVEQRSWLHDPDPTGGLAAVARHDIGCVLADGRSPLVDALVEQGWTPIGTDRQSGAVAPPTR